MFCSWYGVIKSPKPAPKQMRPGGVLKLPLLHHLAKIPAQGGYLYTTRHNSCCVQRSMEDCHAQAAPQNLCPFPSLTCLSPIFWIPLLPSLQGGVFRACALSSPFLHSPMPKKLIWRHKVNKYILEKRRSLAAFCFVLLFSHLMWGWSSLSFKDNLLDHSSNTCLL